MPSQYRRVLTHYWRRSTKTKEYLRRRLLRFVYDALDNEVLPNRSNSRSECLKQLPVNSVIEHIQQNYCLVTNAHVTISKQLNEKFLNPVQSLLIICNLSYKERSLNLFQIFSFLLKLPLSEFIYKFLIALFIEWELFDVDNNLGQSHCKTL